MYYLVACLRSFSELKMKLSIAILAFLTSLAIASPSPSSLRGIDRRAPLEHKEYCKECCVRNQCCDGSDCVSCSRSYNASPQVESADSRCTPSMRTSVPGQLASPVLKLAGCRWRLIRLVFKEIRLFFGCYQEGGRHSLPANFAAGIITLVCSCVGVSKKIHIHEP